MTESGMCSLSGNSNEEDACRLPCLAKDSSSISILVLCQMNTASRLRCIVLYVAAMYHSNRQSLSKALHIF